MIRNKNTFNSFREYADFYKNSEGYDLSIDKITPADDTGIPSLHRWEWGLNKIKELKAKRVLDVGSWTGRFPLILQRNNIYVEAVEANKAAYKYLVKNVDVVAHNTMFEYFDGDKFEVITAFEVIEHIYNPKKFLRKVKKHLVPGGYFIFSTPAKDGIYDDDNRLHLWIATLPSLIDFLKKDFDVVDYHVDNLILICGRMRD